MTNALSSHASEVFCGDSNNFENISLMNMKLFEDRFHKKLKCSKFLRYGQFIDLSEHGQHNA